MIFNNLMIMYVHRDKADQLEILDIAEKFIGENSRRKALLNGCGHSKFSPTHA